MIVALVVAACRPGTRGWSTTLTAGVQISAEHTTAVVALEVAAAAHEELSPRPPPRGPRSPDDVSLQEWDDHEPRWPHRHLGIQATAGTGIMLDGGGATSLVMAGVDYLPFLSDTHGVVGFGGQIAYAAGSRTGVVVVAPRLWFTLPIGELASAPLLLGLMLRGQFGPDGEGGAGPSLVLTRSRL